MTVVDGLGHFAVMVLLTKRKRAKKEKKTFAKGQAI